MMTSYIWLLCSFVCLATVLPLRYVEADKPLYIGGIFPMTGGWAGGKGCRPAVDMALHDVNTHPDILPGYTLNMVANDSMCMPGLGMNVLYELLYNPPSKLMLLGPGCSVVSTFVGQAAKMWNLIVLSYGSSSPALSNRERFPTFFRTHPTATLHNPTRVKLFQKFQWTRIATIQETQEVFTSTIEDLEERVKQAKVEIAVRTSFLTDPTNAVRNLKRQDARIIVGLFYEDMARRVFCEVYKQKMFGPKYVWLIIGWYPDNWYRQPDPSINCTAEQMQKALEGHFTTEGLMLNQDNSPTISGQTSQQFLSRIKKSIGGTDPLSVTGYVEAPLAYDAVWALALALNKTQTRLVRQNQSLEQFNYSHAGIMREIYSAMNASDFLGVSGRVAFNSEGDRIAWTQVEQMLNGNYNKVGYYDIGSDNLTWYGNEQWPRDKPPQDRTIVVPKLRYISKVLFISMSLLASLGIGAAMALLAFNLKYEHRRYIKMSQPHINNVMLVGCMVCLACIFLEGLDGRYVPEGAFVVLCQVRAWVLSIGFTLAYGSLFTKVWVIYRLTTRRKKDIKLLREWEMYVVLSLLLVIDIIVMTTWQVVDPLTRSLESFAHTPSDDLEKDIEVKPQLEHCSCQHINTWLGVLFSYKGVLLLFGILLAYETRNVKIKQVNDSRFVGMSIYNIVVLCIITAPVTLIISSHQDASFAFISVAIILSSFLAMGLIFVPKVLEVLQHPRDGAESAALTDSNPSREEEERHNRLICENNNIKQQIAEKEDKIKDLNEQLQDKMPLTYDTLTDTSAHTHTQSSTHYTAHTQLPHTQECSDRSTIGEVHLAPEQKHFGTNGGGIHNHGASAPDLCTISQHNGEISPSQHSAHECVDNLLNMSPTHLQCSRGARNPEHNSSNTRTMNKAERSPAKSVSDTSLLKHITEPTEKSITDAHHRTKPATSRQGKGHPGSSRHAVSRDNVPSRHGMSGDLGSPTPVMSQTYIAPTEHRRRSDPDEIYSESYC